MWNEPVVHAKKEDRGRTDDSEVEVDGPRILRVESHFQR